MTLVGVSRHARDRAAAGAFLAHLYSPRSQAAIAAGIRNFPALPSAWPELLQLLGCRTAVQEVEQAMAGSRPWSWAHNAWSEALAIDCHGLFRQVVQGTATAKEAAAAAAVERLPVRQDALADSQSLAAQGEPR